jgi:hypothetical protein
VKDEEARDQQGGRAGDEGSAPHVVGVNGHDSSLPDCALQCNLTT